MTTNRVRKVRARSSAALRVVAFGTARISAGAAELEMDVMCAPARVVVSDVAAGSPFQQGATRQNADMSRLAGRRFRPVRYRNQSQRSKLDQRFRLRPPVPRLQRLKRSGR